MSIALLCLWVSTAAAADGEIRCGRLSTRIAERIADEKKGDLFTHQTEVYLDGEKNVPVVAHQTVGTPEVGCLRKSALMVAGDNPVEGRSGLLVFPDGHYMGLWWDTPVEFHDSQAILRGPILEIVYRDEDREKIPPEFRGLFKFIDRR